MNGGRYGKHQASVVLFQSSPSENRYTGTMDRCKREEGRNEWKRRRRERAIGQESLDNMGREEGDQERQRTDHTKKKLCSVYTLHTLKAPFARRLTQHSQFRCFSSKAAVSWCPLSRASCNAVRPWESRAEVSALFLRRYSTFECGREIILECKYAW